MRQPRRNLLLFMLGLMAAAVTSEAESNIERCRTMANSFEPTDDPVAQKAQHALCFKEILRKHSPELLTGTDTTRLSGSKNGWSATISVKTPPLQVMGTAAAFLPGNEALCDEYLAAGCGKLSKPQHKPEL